MTIFRFTKKEDKQSSLEIVDPMNINIFEVTNHQGKINDL